MRLPKFYFAALFAITLFVGAGQVSAMMFQYSVLELAEKNPLVFVGTVTAVDARYATLRLEEVLSGPLSDQSLQVTPVTIAHCTGSNINFHFNERVLIFGSRTEGKPIEVGGQGQGAVKLSPEQKDVEVTAAKRLIDIVALDSKAKDQAMLAEALSVNPRLRAEAQSYIAIHLSHRPTRNEYKKEFIALIQNENPEIQQMGLQGLQFVPAPETISRIIELTRSPQMNVITTASLALAQYDTPESVAALIALTQHADSAIRMRACIDIDRSRRPEAKAALKRVLSDKDPRVRAMGPRGLVYWLRDNQAEDVLPKLVEMLNDPDAQVRASVARHLGECRNSQLVSPLLAALKNDPPDSPVKVAILEALYCHYSKGDDQAREAIDGEIQLITHAVKTGGVWDSFGPAFHAVGILGLCSQTEAREVLRWAAESHPNLEIKAYAQRSLKQAQNAAIQ